MRARDVGLGLEHGLALVGSTTSSLPLAVSLSSSVTEPLSSPGLLGVMMAPSLVPLILTVMVSGSCRPAIVHVDGEGLGDGLAGLQFLDGRVGGIQVIGPLAGLVDGEGAVLALRRC